MILSDRTIREEIAAGRIEIDPFDESCVQPSSVEVKDGEPFILHPGEFVLGATRERIRLPEDLVARLEGNSSLGRLGLLIHSTAGTSTRAGTVTSRSSSRTWPTSRSRSTRA